MRYQRRAEFQSLLQKALAVDPDVRPEMRLVNLVAQRRARWLLSRTDELFLEGAAGQSGDAGTRRRGDTETENPN